VEVRPHKEDRSRAQACLSDDFSVARDGRRSYTQPSEEVIRSWLSYFIQLNVIGIRTKLITNKNNWIAFYCTSLSRRSFLGRDCLGHK